MSELATQAHGLINAASVATSEQRKGSPSASSAMLARIIVSEAKKQCPDDAAIQSIDLEGKAPDWNEISAAMNVIVRALD
jgi:hypothetical protein